MSQNKTIVPDVNYEELGDSTAFNNLYSPSSNSVPDNNKTVIPGSQIGGGDGYSSVPSSTPSSMGLQEQNSDRAVKMQDRVVVGVLFSISKGLLGEIFPLYLGRNIIGTTDFCDVCLREKTVSSEHAILYIRKNPGGGFEITITDYNSMYGSAVNNVDARYEVLPVHENDVITIGRHYKLLLKLFDTELTGLEEDPGFESLPQSSPAMQQGGGRVSYSQQQEVPQQPDMGDFYSPSQQNDSSKTVIS